MTQFTLYRAYIKQRRPSGSTQSWQVVLPMEISYTDGSGHTTVIEQDSTHCGYVPPIEPQYRWVNIPINQDYQCDTTTYTKYYKQKKQVSYDNGATWNDVSPAQYQRGAAYETNSIDCGYQDILTGYAGEYLTFVVKSDGTFKFNDPIAANTLSYSLDNGATWTALANNTDTPTVAAGNKIMWKGNCTPSTSYGIGRFSSTAQFDAEGNPMSLIFGDSFRVQRSLSGRNSAFLRLFSRNSNLLSAENLALPATTLSDYCYYGMFEQCTNLTTAPELPATILTRKCYQWMFEECTSLTTAPVLPATTLAEGCYYDMFYGCTSLTTAPALPATTLAPYCYNAMFRSCTSLTTAPSLPATTLANYCYNAMFYACTSLTTAPSLPATTLAEGCYFDMFALCPSLTTPPALPATALASNCYQQMFAGCESLTTAPSLPATTLAYRCYHLMFASCANLNSITCLATDISASDCTYFWLDGVAANGTFTKAASMTSWPSGRSGIPNGWTVVDYA